MNTNTNTNTKYTTNNNDKKDPFVRGPVHSVEGQLVPLLDPSLHSPTIMKHSETLRFTLHLHDNGVARVRITEPNNSSPRWTYDEEILTHEHMNLATDVKLLTHVPAFIADSLSSSNTEDNYMIYSYAKERYAIVLQLSPFQYSMFDLELRKELLQVNSNQLFHFESHGIDKKRFDDGNNDGIVKEERKLLEEEDRRHGGKEVVGYWEDGLAIYADGTREEQHDDEVDNEVAENNEDDEYVRGMWDENFHEHKDSKPNGPMSVGVDIKFVGSKHLYGLPEHASSTKLKNTLGRQTNDYTDPYRLYNLDVFEYDLDVPMALYGAVPLIISHSKDATTGAFWFNPTESFIDVDNISEGKSSNAHWISESGIFDLFLLPGPNPRDIYSQYASLTGYTEMPPMFALGYHQCRWNYNDERDVFNVHEKFEELDYPYDVLWLDIEHTDGKRYFTWDKNNFPEPIKMQNKLSSQGRKMVTIVDPHIKRDPKYRIHSEATKNGYYIKDSKGEKDFDGWCWPGSSSYLDFTDSRVRKWWAEQFSLKKYEGSTLNLYIWNDMNEPSVFNGPEVSMQKDLLNLQGIEHREWHNLYGQLFHRATAEGLILRSNDRPFVLSRSFFAGSQRYGAIWTGDNAAEWSHLQVAAPMLLSLNIGGLSFVGADVGGFFGDPDAELMTRWVQAGSYQPFFRGHAHHDSKRREPWVFGEETMNLLRESTIKRYALLPYWYTIFHEANTTGMPVMRTMWMEYPKADESLFDLDDQWLIGSALLVKPVTSPTAAGGSQEVSVKIPKNTMWYDIDTYALASPRKNNIIADGIDDDTADNEQKAYGVGFDELIVECPLDKIPAFQRGGSIIPRKLRLRRSASLMIDDPYTLYVALDSRGAASGTLYMDDEHSFDFKSGYYALSSMKWDEHGLFQNTVSSSKLSELLRTSSGDGKKIGNRLVERVIVMGVEKFPRQVLLLHTGTSEGEGSGKENLPSSLMYSFDDDLKLLIIRNPGVSMLRQWEIQVNY